MAYNLKDSTQIKVSTNAADDLELAIQTGILPTKTSQLVNDSDYVSDAAYVHTDNNYNQIDKNKVSKILIDGNSKLFLNQAGNYTEGVSGEKGTMWFTVNNNIDSPPINSRLGDYIINGNQIPIVVGDTELAVGAFCAIDSINPFNISLLGALKGVQGNTGPQGIQGNPGIKGDKGDTGAQGIQGPKGDTLVSVQVGTTQTGEPNTQASVNNRGTSTEAILDFMIPRGNQGIQGIQGVQGEKGEKGDTGDTLVSIGIGNTQTGNPGSQALVTNVGTPTEAILDFIIPTGEKGNKGDKGDTLVSLQVGNVQTGNPGTPANVLNVGTPTEAILDFTIPKGDKGDKGDTGNTGAKGEPGTDGQSVISSTLTQSEYDNLTIDQKNNGTLYYVVEG